MEPNETSLITSERQIFHSKKALNALNRIQKLSITEETELIAEELRLASKHISNITSLIDNEEVLDKIFSSFIYPMRRKGWFDNFFHNTFFQLRKRNVLLMLC